MIRTNRFASYPHEFKVEAVRLVRESGKSTREIATDLGVSVVSLNRWLKDPELGGARGTGSSGSLDSEERAELRRLRREVRVLREEREILKKSRGLLRGGDQEPEVIYRFIHAEKTNHPVSIMCGVPPFSWTCNCLS